MAISVSRSHLPLHEATAPEQAGRVSPDRSEEVSPAVHGEAVHGPIAAIEEGDEETVERERKKKVSERLSRMGGVGMFGPRPAPGHKSIQVVPESQSSFSPTSPQDGTPGTAVTDSSPAKHEITGISQAEQEEEDDSISQYITAPPPSKDVEAMRSPIRRSLPPPPPPPMIFSSSGEAEENNPYTPDMSLPPPSIPASSRPNRRPMPPPRLPPASPLPPPQTQNDVAQPADDEEPASQEDEDERATGPTPQTPLAKTVLVTGPSPRTSDEIAQDMAHQTIPELTALTLPSSEVMADTDTGAFATVRTRSL